MISIVNWILNLVWPKRFGSVIYVRRTLGTKGFRIHLLALSTAFFAVLAGIFAAGLPTYSLPFICWTVAILFAGSIFGAMWLPLIILAGILALAGGLAALHPEAPQVFVNYCSGYLVGALLGILYNDLVYLHQRFFRRTASRIVYAYDTERSLNFIMSPKIKEVMHAVPPADRDKYFQPDPDEPDKMIKKIDTWLYDFQPDHEPPYPFTVAIIANPIFREKVEDGYREMVDPISEDRELFMRSAERALQSLSQNHVVGAPEIWSKIRIVTVFHKLVPEERWEDVGMAQSYEAGLYEISGYEGEGNIAIDGVSTDDLIDAAAHARDRYLYMLNAASKEFPTSTGANGEDLDPEQLCRETDMLIILSAVPKYKRATAQFANWYEDDTMRPLQPDMNGEEFELEKVRLPEKCEDPVHAFYFHNPGRMAVNVLEASFRTYIHEFGHAISDVDNGVIVDEYYDRFFIDNLPDKPSLNIRWFDVNRFSRKVDKDTGRILQPIPREFSEYRLKLAAKKEPKTAFQSDIDHPSGKENWLGFFPARDNLDANCIMDRTGVRNRFDGLLSKFIYDRLWVKVNRMKRAAASRKTAASSNAKNRSTTTDKSSKSKRKGVDKDASL